MTLILSAQTDRLVILSDIVTSREGRHDAQVRGLPLTPRPITVASDNHTLVGLAQKAVQFSDRHVLLWAGTEIIARHIWTVFAAVVAVDPNAKLLDFIEALDIPESEKKETSFIYHRLDSEGRCFREAYNAKRADIGGVDTFFSGTGDFHFIDDIRPVFATPDTDPSRSFLRDWLHRIGYTILSEAIDGENLQYAYGGWFEITLYEDGRFRKIPYLIKLWEERSGQIINAPCICGWYKDAHLCLLRSHVKKNEAETTNDVTVVRDPLRRTEPPPDRNAAAATYQEALLQIHLIFNAQRQWAIVTKGGDTPDFYFRVKAGKLEIHWSSSLGTELMAALQGPTDGQIIRPFSDPS